jgi:hypothetical protein
VVRKVLAAAFVLLAILVAGALVARRLVNPEAIRAAVERQATEALRQPVKVGAVDWALSVRPRLVLSGVQVGDPVAITVSRVELTTGLRALLSKRLEHGSLSIAGSRIVLPLPISLGARGPATPPSTSPPVAGGGTRDFVVASIDRISLSDIDLVVGGRQVRLDAESSLVGDRLAVSRFRLESGQTAVEGKGEFSSLGARRGVFSASADLLDLDELLALASGLTGQAESARQAAASERPAPMDVRVDLKAARGHLVGIPFTTFATVVALQGEEVVLDPLGARVFDGTLAGRLRVDTRSAPVSTSISAKLAGLDVAPMAAMARQAGALTGRLAGQVQLHADTGPADAVVRRAAGTARVEIADGTAPFLDLVGPVILAFGRPNPSSAAPRSREFSRLSGTFALTGGVLRSNDLAMTSRDVDLRGQGSVRLPGGEVDVKADLVLSEALSAQAGRDLIRYASEGSHVVLPATITGTLTSPSVSIDLDAALQRAALNALKDKMKKELGRLFKR